MEKLISKNRRPREIIDWIDVRNDLPDAGMEVLVCYQRNDCVDRDVTMATYDDSDEDDGPWTVDGGLMCFGEVLYWSEMPIGPQTLAKVADVLSESKEENQ